MISNSTPEKVTAEHVLWYIPNKIGYVRVITAALSFFVMKNHPRAFTWLYSTSCLLDALDGTMARKYNQVSSLGAVLDMVTDRSSTAGLMCFLCVQYPQWCVFFQLMLGLDITSHYMHMYASLSAGKTSHKSVGEGESRLLHLYYTRRDVLFTICAFNELFYAGLYLQLFSNSATFGKWTTIISFPGYVFKQTANVVQLKRAALILADNDAKNANEKNKTY